MRTMMILFLLCAFLIPLKGQNVPPDSLQMAQLLPDSANGWHRLPKDRFYNANRLYEFIDGAAQEYLSYGFRCLLHRVYRRPNQTDIILDFYDMRNPENSLGLFLQKAQSPDSLPRFGQGSQYTQGYLIFWKGPYFISLLAYPETKQSKKCLLRIAAFIDKKLKSVPVHPQLLQLLPIKNRIAHSLRYFHSYFWLQRFFRLPVANIFKINDHVKIALARYKDGSTLAIIRYPDADLAQKAWQSVTRTFPKFRRSDFIQHNGSGYLLKRQGNLLLFVRNSRHPRAVKNFSGLFTHLKVFKENTP